MPAMMNNTVSVEGYCDKRFNSLKTLMQQFLKSGEELGTSLTVNIDDKEVVDIWGGFADEEKTRPWERDTIACMWSTTKNISSLAALVLVDRGLLDLDERVSKYWPEFAANGKQDVKVRHVISHTSGVPAWEKPITIEDIYDLETATARLAQQPPWWKPGTASGYHAHTHGFLIGELVKRVTGKSLKQFIAEDLAGPLNADFQIGALEKDHPRVATMISPPTSWNQNPQLPPGSVMEKARNAPVTKPTDSNTPKWRNAELGGMNGHGNSRSVTRILSPISLSGTVNGTTFLSPSTIEKIFEGQAYGQDLVVPLRLRFGTGFGLPAKDTYFNWVPTDGRVCGWGGLGGSMALMDLDRRLTIGYVMNKMHNVGMGSNCTRAYFAEIYRVLGVEI